MKTTKDELELTIGYLNKLMSEQNLKLDNSVTDLTRLSEEMDTKILNTDLLLHNFKNEMEPKLSNIYEGLSKDIKSLEEISNIYESNGFVISLEKFLSLSVSPFSNLKFSSSCLSLNEESFNSLTSLAKISFCF